MGGVLKSSDRGAHWKQGAAGLEFIDLRVLATDPVQASTLHSGRAAGLFKSRDGSGHWTALGPLTIKQQPDNAFGFNIGDTPGVVRSLALGPGGDVVYVQTSRANGCLYSDKLV